MPGTVKWTRTLMTLFTEPLTVYGAIADGSLLFVMG